MATSAPDKTSNGLEAEGNNYATVFFRDESQPNEKIRLVSSKCAIRKLDGPDKVMTKEELDDYASRNRNNVKCIRAIVTGGNLLLEVPDPYNDGDTYREGE
mmetsp:Transcript_6083/g.11921  ORF Transcript_6083/g.11921 Transcript_6083/m.11921 type:complete len:101 (-) Transcript_6083:150-452(-)|eukprot:scaffold13656_cov147-Amphora_coffeaeformis.AAC.3